MASPGEPPVDTSYFGEWRRCVGDLPRLTASGSIVGRTVRKLKRLTHIDPGDGARNWIHWIQLGRWLEAREQRLPPPGMPDVANPLSEIVPHGFHLEWFETVSCLPGPDGHPEPHALVVALLGVGLSPADARCWLALGRLLAMDGSPHEAGVAFRYGLERAPRPLPADTPAVVWHGLARALESTGSPRWPDRFWEYGEGPRSRGLDKALGEMREDPDSRFFESILRGAGDPGPETMAILGTLAGDTRRGITESSRAPR